MQTQLQIHPTEIGFDFDGVIADTAEAFVRLACEDYGYCSFTHEDITNFELEECINMPKDLVDRIFWDILSDSLSTGLKPMEGAIDVLGDLAGLGSITIITARPEKQPTIDWLDKFLPHSTNKAINLVAMGDHNDKLRYIREHNLNYFIDDRAQTCTMLAESGITPLVYTHPWNRDRHNLATVNNWQEIRDLIIMD